MKKVAILQSNYIPWKGYFDLINSVDDFVFYDTAQYTKNDWRNRNKVNTKQGVKWVTIPVYAKGKSFQKINETIISDVKWGRKHWATISQSYTKAPFFKKYAKNFEELYLNNEELNLSRVNYQFISLINKLLGIETRLHWASDFELIDGKSERLLGLCKELNADVYLSGPAAKDYLDESIFKENNIAVEWMGYTGYPEYRQQHEPFEHGVTILDLIFNKGPDAVNYMKSFSK